MLLPHGATAQIALPLLTSSMGAGPEPPAGLAGQVLSEVPPGGARVAEEIAIRLDASIDQVLAALLELEIEGWVKRLPGSAYGR